jgi:glucosamine 6-phosphate synthetase-like amidotransferase/phosphosugar isomerase protein
VFILLDDEHRSQILSNILQVKERGATTIIVTNNADLSKLIDMNKLDFVVQMPKSSSPQDGDTFAALQAVVPLQMICYQTTVKRGLNPD